MLRAHGERRSRWPGECGTAGPVRTPPSVRRGRCFRFCWWRSCCCRWSSPALGPRPTRSDVRAEACSLEGSCPTKGTGTRRRRRSRRRRRRSSYCAHVHGNAQLKPKRAAAAGAPPPSAAAAPSEMKRIPCHTEEASGALHDHIVEALASLRARRRIWHSKRLSEAQRHGVSGGRGGRPEEEAASLLADENFC